MSIVGRRGPWLLIIATTLLLGSCSELASPPPEDATSNQQMDWKRIGGGGAFRSIEAINSLAPPPHLTAAGVKDGKPFVGYVVGGELTEIPFRSEGASGDGIRAMTDDGANIAVTDDTDPRSGEPAHLWNGYSDPPDPDIISPFREMEALRTTAGLRPVWLAPLSTSEDFGVIGVVRANDRWRVHGWLVDVEWMHLDKRSPLYLRGTPSNERLLTGMTESSMLAAGDLTAGESGAGSACSSLNRATRLQVRADADLGQGVSLRFLRRGDMRGEIALAQMHQGELYRSKLPPELCSGVASSKVEIQVMGGKQVVDTLGPYNLRC